MRYERVYKVVVVVGLDINLGYGGTDGNYLNDLILVVIVLIIITTVTFISNVILRKLVCLSAVS